MSAAIEAVDLFRIFSSPEGTSVALQGLTLEVDEGELLVVFGPSGSGKSTLLRILAGLDRPSAGTVRVLGEDLRTLRGRGLAEYRSRTLGYADQHYTRALAPELSARRLVALRLGLLGVTAAEADRTADALLERVGLLDRRDARPSELSGGQQQRVAIVRALAMRPDILLLDEVTSALDPVLVAEVLDAIRELAEQGMTMVIATHEMGFAKDVANDVAFLHEGRILEEGPPSTIFSEPTNPETRLFLDRIIAAGRM
jgi:polar amino acid transport system ATP-binding protein